MAATTDRGGKAKESSEVGWAEAAEDRLEALARGGTHGFAPFSLKVGPLR